MNKHQRQQLNFEPVYHRRLSRDKFTPVRKSLIKQNVVESVRIERERILKQGFNVVESETDTLLTKIENSDKGNVVSVIANTNPMFS